MLVYHYKTNSSIETYCTHSDKRILYIKRERQALHGSDSSLKESPWANYISGAEKEASVVSNQVKRTSLSLFALSL